jgi:hypothetical protein
VSRYADNCKIERLELFFDSLCFNGAETVRELVGSAFYLSKDTFDAVPITVLFISAIKVSRWNAAYSHGVESTRKESLPLSKPGFRVWITHKPFRPTFHPYLNTAAVQYSQQKTVS